jgi:hypothetical protein
MGSLELDRDVLQSYDADATDSTTGHQEEEESTDSTTGNEEDESTDSTVKEDDDARSMAAGSLRPSSPVVTHDIVVNATSTVLPAESNAAFSQWLAGSGLISRN